ncbi:MAG: penicillin-binding protein 1C [Hyphomicrobium sp.]|nr:penicillin-binding protein 1C [Hyphomicrobium sp.]
MSSLLARKTWTRRALIACAACLALVVTAVAGVAIAKRVLGPVPVENADAVSTIVLDRHGKLLRAFTTPDGRWRLPVEPEDIDPRYFAILKAFEDRRFEDHGGVDFYGLGRAVTQAVEHGRLVSGGSTITMQVARLLEARHDKTAIGKLRQMVRAWQLEEQLSKRQIMTLYLRMAPFGGNIEGVRAASLAYFGKEPARLSIGEAALLVALPQSPETRRPDRNWKAAERARGRVLDRAFEAGVISAAERDRAKGEAVPKGRRDFPKRAPHLSEREVAGDPSRKVHRLTLDGDLQGALEALLSDQTPLLGEKLSAAILAVDNKTGEVLAHVGSPGYLDATRQGAIDMTDAVRSPGSTLKPLIYGLAFESGLAHPETLIEDRPTRFGAYRPENFDEEFHGTVTVREALGLSLNVPAVKVLSALGPATLTSRLKRAGVDAELPLYAQPSLAVGLGGIGMKLSSLATLYVALARGGDPVPLGWHAEKILGATHAPNARDALARRLLSPVAAWYVSDILKDAPAPLNAKSGRLAYKTGTSYGYRDAWAAGYDGRHTIAVWVGRPDGASVPGLMGRIAAAPILFDAFQRISERRAPLAPMPRGVMKVAGADLPPPLKRFRDGYEAVTTSGAFVTAAPLIAFPPDRSELDVSERGDEPIVLKAEGGALPLTWLVDGAPIGVDGRVREIEWTPPGRGFVKLQVIDANGEVDRVTVRLR